MLAGVHVACKFAHEALIEAESEKFEKTKKLCNFHEV